MGSTRPMWVGSKNPLNLTQPDPCTPLLTIYIFKEVRSFKMSYIYSISFKWSSIHFREWCGVSQAWLVISQYKLINVYSTNKISSEYFLNLNSRYWHCKNIFEAWYVYLLSHNFNFELIIATSSAISNCCNFMCTFNVCNFMYTSYCVFKMLRFFWNLSQSIVWKALFYDSIGVCQLFNNSFIYYLCF